MYKKVKRLLTAIISEQDQPSTSTYLKKIIFMELIEHLQEIPNQLITSEKQYKQRNSFWQKYRHDRRIMTEV
jgi:hypothetical protein